MKKVLLLMILISVAGIVAADPDFELWNKTNSPIYFTVAHKGQDPLKSNFTEIKSNAKTTMNLDNSAGVKVAISYSGHKPFKGDEIFIYEIKPRKKIYAQVKKNGKIEFGPQTPKKLALSLQTESGYSLRGGVNFTIADVKESKVIFGRDPSDSPATLLNLILKDFELLAANFKDALEKNKFNANEAKATADRLAGYLPKIGFLSRLDSRQKNELKPLAQKIDQAYNALNERTYILNLWMQNYDAFEKDINYNFRNLPNNSVQKPDPKKLYEELGFKPGEGQKASFDAVKQKYQQRYNELKNKASINKEDFDFTYFRNYLRALEYLFRNPANKTQYDTYLQGSSAYNSKVNNFKKYEQAVNSVLRNPDILEVRGTVTQELK